MTIKLSLASTVLLYVFNFLPLTLQLICFHSEFVVFIVLNVDSVDVKESDVVNPRRGICDSYKKLWVFISDQNASFELVLFWSLSSRGGQKKSMCHAVCSKVGEAASYQSEINQGGCKQDIKYKIHRCEGSPLLWISGRGPCVKLSRNERQFM